MDADLPFFPPKCIKVQFIFQVVGTLTHRHSHDVKQTKSLSSTAPWSPFNAYLRIEGIFSCEQVLTVLAFTEYITESWAPKTLPLVHQWSILVVFLAGIYRSVLRML